MQSIKGILLLMAAMTVCANVVRAAPSQLGICITMAETAISDLPIPPEVVMLERKLWIVNEQYRWRVSLSQLLASRDKKTRIPDPAGAPKYRKSFDKAIMKFIKETAKRFKVDSACGEELSRALMPTNDQYQRLVAEKHVDLDYVVGLADMSVKWMAEQITLIS